MTAKKPEKQKTIWNSIHINSHAVYSYVYRFYAYCATSK